MLFDVWFHFWFRLLVGQSALRNRQEDWSRGQDYIHGPEIHPHCRAIYHFENTNSRSVRIYILLMLALLCDI
jgi:hypothetical protein